MEAVFDLSAYRGDSRPLVEFSGLAVERSGVGISLPLLRAGFRVALDVYGAGRVAIAVHPKHIAFYESLFFFERLGQVSFDGFVGGHPAIGAVMDIERTWERMEKLMPRLHAYFTGDDDAVR
jgi:hypothetical protein